LALVVGVGELDGDGLGDELGKMPLWDGDGDGDGELDGKVGTVTDDDGLGDDGFDDGVALFCVFPMCAGAGNGSAGLPASAAVIICCQVSAGRPAPYTSPPWSVTILCGLLLPYQTAVDSCGVKPMNHASVFPELLVAPLVPVLPAAGRPGNARPHAVPCEPQSSTFVIA
jgi:hypothetical protein